MNRETIAPESGGSQTTIDTFRYDNRIVRAFAIATVIWGIVGMSAGLLATVQLFWPEANLNLQFVSFGRLRPLHTNAVIFAFVGNGMFMGIYYSLQRLCKARMFCDRLSWINFCGWNAIIVAAAITLPLRLTMSKEYAELEWPIDIAIALVWVVFTVNLIGTILKRREKHLYVAIWFYIATALTVAVLHIMELWTAFVLGMVGSLHCAGMCGPLAVALPATGNSQTVFVLGRVAYNSGRVITYSLLGALFGVIGQTFALAGLQRWLSLAAGIAILIAFFATTKFALNARISHAVDILKSALRKLLRHRTFNSLLLLGMLNGLLPCGLVYVACVGATATGKLLSGIQYMFLFGLGTAPMFLTIGLLGKKLHFALRLKFQKLIPICFVLLGVLLILRGLSLGIPYVTPDLSASSGGRACH